MYIKKGQESTLGEMVSMVKNPSTQLSFSIIHLRYILIFLMPNLFEVRYIFTHFYLDVRALKIVRKTDESLVAAKSSIEYF